MRTTVDDLIDEAAAVIVNGDRDESLNHLSAYDARSYFYVNVAEDGTAYLGGPDGRY